MFPVRPRSARRAITAAALLASLAACSSNKSNSPTQPSSPARTIYAAIGASDAVGIGASVPCLPFVDCPTGTGYVPVLGRKLAAAGQQVQTTNLGVPAAVLSPEIQALGNKYGRTTPANFLQGELTFVPRDATLVTIFAGGNDTNVIGAAAEGGEGGPDPTAFIDQQIAGFGRSYESLIRGIRDRAPGARIVVANLPNMAALPYASGMSFTRRQWLQRIAVGITRDAVNPLASQNVRVVDLMCDARSYDPGNYSSDGFHPNDRGYAYMADLFYDAVMGASGTPLSNCSQMSQVQ
jgi:lysophospholipase L1-like esterase